MRWEKKSNNTQWKKRCCHCLSTFGFYIHYKYMNESCIIKITFEFNSISALVNADTKTEEYSIVFLQKKKEIYKTTIRQQRIESLGTCLVFVHQKPTKLFIHLFFSSSPSPSTLSSNKFFPVMQFNFLTFLFIVYCALKFFNLRPIRKQNKAKKKKGGLIR